jgi:hypothetical protein
MKRTFIVLVFIMASGMLLAQKGTTKQYSLITDLVDTSGTVRSIGMLLNKLKVYEVSQVKEDEILSRKDGLVILLSKESKITGLKKLTDKYTKAGGTIVMDIKAFAVLNGFTTKIVSTRKIIVKKESTITNGYKKDEPVIYSNKGKLTGLLNTDSDKNITILGESESGDILLMEQKRGAGKVIAVDMLSMPEPQYAIDSENKYLFMVNAIGNRVRYGQFYPMKLKYEEFVSMLKEFVKKYPSVKLIEEGNASGGYKIYSLNMGNSSYPGIFIYSNTHGNEWENSYGTFTFVKYLAEHKDQDIIDLNKYCLKVILILNPFGYENMTRQNGNQVDLNRNGDFAWDKFIGEDPKNYKPGSYDWKGTAPFSEPESRTLKKAAASGNFIAFLDVHGNPSGTGYNKWMGIAANTKPDAKEKGEQFQKIFNENIMGRYILKQSREKYPKLMIIESISQENSSPNLYNTIAKDKYGYIVEFLCGYGNSTGFIAMQDDIITELCAAFCKTFAR